MSEEHAARSDAEESLGELLGSVARRLRGASLAALEPWDVNPSQLRAMRVLLRHGPMRLSELAAELRITPRSTTEVADGLVGKDLARRLPDPDDRRATLVEVTDHGRTLGERLRAARATESDRVFAPLSATDRAELARILRQLRE